ncbi:uncharacterized protein LOC112049550 [Bicyclus anynana]|uniref:Uncharacterized protein LOC112049550 n=1 Tax=Bicyclus anynana TaxID=110368 RepID=A0ABM3M453_BICAN|nr:uncharacterized protein LOC112049550 [Bicyclus anynana]
MRCCVPFCENTFDNMSTSERTGITFHGLPSEGNLRTAWLRALGTQDHHLPDPAVVCSQHFLDDDFYTTESCVRQIHSNAVPSIVQMCMICLDSDSKLSLMSKHKLDEAYEQLTGLSLFQLCRRGNLKQTLCVMCAQRLINFSRFRDLSLRAHSLLTDSVEQRASNTIQHKELMNCTSAHLKCNLTQTTLGANHCDLYIDHTDGEESVVGDVATVVVKNENSSDSMSSADNLELAQEDDNHIDNSNNECASDDEYSDMSIELESRLLDEAISQALRRKADHVAATQSSIKSESDIFQCEFCFEDFVQELAYKEHMSKHLQSAASGAARAAVSRSCDSLVLQNKSVYNDTACAASQVCEPRAAVSRSCDSLVLQNKSVYNDTACAASQVCEPRAAVSRSCDSLVLQNKSVYNDTACAASQVCEPRAAVSRSCDSLVLQNKSVYNDTACAASQVCEPRAAVSRSCDSLVLQNKSVYNDTACAASQVCEPRAAVSRSCDSLVLQNKSVYNDTACAASQVCEPRAAVSRSCDSLVLQNKSVYNDIACAASQVCEPRAAVSRSCDSLVLQNKSVYNDTACAASQVCEPRAAVSRSCDSLVLQNKSVYNDTACAASQV